MSSVAQSGQQDEQKPTRQITWQVVVRALVSFFVMPVVLFVAAGHWDWWMGWAYVGMLYVMAIVSRVLIARKNLDLVSERAQGAEGEGVKVWDKVLVPLVGIWGPAVILIVAGLNFRLAWLPQLPLAIQLVGLALALLGYVFGTWAMVANKFFGAYVRIQADRGHCVIADGPYRYLRHPGYAGGSLTWLVTPLALGSLWALIPAVIVIALIAVRTALEDKMLQEELPGYAEYAQQVHYRLLLGIW